MISGAQPARQWRRSRRREGRAILPCGPTFAALADLLLRGKTTLLRPSSESSSDGLLLAERSEQPSHHVLDEFAPLDPSHKAHLRALSTIATLLPHFYLRARDVMI